MINPNAYSIPNGVNVYIYGVVDYTGTWGTWYDTSTKKWKAVRFIGGTEETNIDIHQTSTVRIAIGQFCMTSAEVFKYAYLYQEPQLLSTVANQSDIVTRLTSAENKITDDAIISTVSTTISNAKKDAIDSANKNTSDKLKNYVTTTSLTQTSNNITAKFSSSGGYNLLKNSKGKNRTTYWLNNGGGISVAGDNTFETCFKTSAPSGIKYSEAIKLKNDTEYVYEGYIYSRTAIGGSSASPLHYWCNTTPNTTEHPQLTVLDYRQQVSSVNKWTKCYVHFRTASSGDVYFTPFIYGGGSTTFDIWATELSLSESAVESKWTPHPSEIYEGSTVIDASGITVNNGALRVKNKSGTTVLEGDSNGDLTLKGKVVNGSDIFQTRMERGGLTHRIGNEDVATIRTVRNTDNHSVNGLSIAMMPDGDFLDLGYTNGTTFDSTTPFYPSLRISKGNAAAGGFNGVQLYADTLFRTGKHLYFSDGTQYYHEIYASNNNRLAMMGNDGFALGYKEGDTRRSLITGSETDFSTGAKIYAHSGFNMGGNIITNSPSIGNIHKSAIRISNINAYLDSGWYSFDANCAGLPVAKWGILLHIDADYGTDFLQMLFLVDNTMRIRWWVNGAYTVWKTW